ALAGAIAIEAGWDYTCAVFPGGTVRCMGANGSGQLGDGTYDYRFSPVDVTNLAGVTALSASGGHTCATLDDGTARCWGSNYQGELGNGEGPWSATPVSVDGTPFTELVYANGF